jgi:hypothetical protein
MQILLSLLIAIWLAFGAWIDFALAILPISFIIKLRLDLKRRVGLCVLLSLGAL